MTVESMATGIQDFFDIPAWDLSIYVGSRTWELFESTDGELLYLMGLVDTGEHLLTVILAAPPDVFPEYRALVFIPALDAIKAVG